MTSRTTARRGALIGLAVAGALAGSAGTAGAQYYVYEEEVYEYPSFPRRGYIYGYDYDYQPPRPPASIGQGSARRIATRDHGLARVERSIRRGGSWVVDGIGHDGARLRLILDARSGELIDSVLLAPARPPRQPEPRMAHVEPQTVPAPRALPRTSPRATPSRVAPAPRLTPVPVPPQRPATLPPAQASAPARATPPSPAAPQRAAPAPAAAPQEADRPGAATGPDGRPVRVIPMGPQQAEPAKPAPAPAEAKAPATEAPSAPASARPAGSDAPRLIDPEDVRPAEEPDRTPPLARALDLPPPAVMPPVELKEGDTAPAGETPPTD